MKSLKIKTTPKRTNKNERERFVLLGLVEQYIKSGKPVGSNTLKEAGFDNLSSATIRNYFANLEEEGFLTQQHASGGRLPTPLAYRYYANEYINHGISTETKEIQGLKEQETKEIPAFLQQSAEILSKATNCAVFLSAPRFDHDYVTDIRLVSIDTQRCLCILITDFGLVETEVLPIEIKLNNFSLHRIENYFQWRLRGLNKPENLTEEEEKIAQRFYNELMMRYIVGYSNFIDEEIYRTGFSHLLKYPDFYDTTALATSLALFENAQSMRMLLRECTKLNTLKYWIGPELMTYSTTSPECSVLAIPYRINNRPVGAIGILGPMRIPYRQFFSLLKEYQEAVSDTLTRSVYKFKISFRQPETGTIYLRQEENRLIGESRMMLLEYRNQIKGE